VLDLGVCSDPIRDKPPTLYLVHPGGKPILTPATRSAGTRFLFTSHCDQEPSRPIIDHLPSPPIPLNRFFVSLAPAMSSSNTTVLARSHAIAAKKRKAKRGEIQEIVFDDEARR